MSFDAGILTEILRDASNPDQYLNGCTVQLYGGGTGDDPVLFADIKDQAGNPMRDGSRGLVLQSVAWKNPSNVQPTGGHTVFYIGDHNNDGVLRLQPADDRGTYISWHTCGGGCNWNAFRAVVNVRANGNKGIPSDITTHFKTKFLARGADSTRAGTVLLEATSRPGFYVAGATEQPNMFALQTGWVGEQQAYLRIRIMSLGPDLARAYYKARLEGQNEHPRVLCCKGEYNEFWNTQGACEKGNLVPGSAMCDPIIQKICPPGTTDPLCGCSSNHAKIQAIPSTSRQFQQIRAFPQCFLESCTGSDAYKFSSQRTNQGGANCPNITICEQNIDMETRAKLINSAIVQNCNQDAARDPVPAGPTPAGPTPAGPAAPPAGESPPACCWSSGCSVSRSPRPAARSSSVARATGSCRRSRGCSPSGRSPS